MLRKLTKQELIDILQSDAYLAYSGDKLCEWLIDLKYAYVDPGDNEELDELVQDYWPLEDIADYLIAKLQSPVLGTMQALREVATEMRNKEFRTHWSYYETDVGYNFIDVEDDNLHQLRLRMLEVLKREESND